MSASSIFSGDSRVLPDLLSAGYIPACDPADVPALAGTLIELELWLSNLEAADLESISKLVQSDVGLTLQVLRLARAESGENAPWRISDCVVQLGHELIGLARPTFPRLNDRECLYPGIRGFWKYSQLVASVAELVSIHLKDPDADPEQAYIAGLLHNVDELPALLAQDPSCRVEQNRWTKEEWVAKFNLPEFVIDVLNASRAGIAPSDLTPVCRVVRFAQRWVDMKLDLAGAQLRADALFPVSRAAHTELVSEFFPHLSSPSSNDLLEVLATPSLNDALFDLAENFPANLKDSSQVVLLH